MNRILIALALAVTTACESDPRISAGSDPAPGMARVAGHVDNHDAAFVELGSFDATGHFTAVASADVRADGAFELDAPPNLERVYVVAVSADGDVVAEAFVDRTPAEGESVFAPPVDTESTVEAWLIAELTAQGSEVDPHDVRTRIDAAVAAAVHSNAQVGDLVLAMAAAGSAQTHAWQDAGVTASTETWWRAGISASETANAAAVAGMDSASVARVYLDGLADAAAALGADARERAEAETRASLAWRMALASNADNELVSAGVLASASMEAYAQATLAETWTAAEPESTIARVWADAAAGLDAAVVTAAHAEAAVDAFAAYRGSVSAAVDTWAAPPSQSATDVALHLGMDVDVALDAAAHAGESLTADADAYLASRTDAWTAETYAGAATTLWTAYETAVTASGATSVALDASLAANGSYRGAVD